MPSEHFNTEERLARIERMIEEYRVDQRRRLLQEMSKGQRLAEAHKTDVTLDVPSRLN